MDSFIRNRAGSAGERRLGFCVFRRGRMAGDGALLVGNYMD